MLDKKWEVHRLLTHVKNACDSFRGETLYDKLGGTGNEWNKIIVWSVLMAFLY
jgi:hypothetical protein